MAKVDFTAPAYTNKRVRFVDLDQSQPTLGDLASMLLVGLPQQQGTSAVTRKLRTALSLRIILQPGDVEVSDAEAKLLNDLIDQSTLPPVFGEQISLLLEGKPNPFAPNA